MDAECRSQYAQVICELKDFVPESGIHVGREVGRPKPSRGYVYALTDQGGECRRVYLGWAGPTKMREQLRRLQAGNSAELRVVAVMQRDNVADAKLIFDMLYGGLLLTRHIRGQWFTTEDEQKIIDAFGRVDQLVGDGA